MATKTLVAALAAATIFSATIPAHADSKPVPSVYFGATALWTIAMDPNQSGGCYMESQAVRDHTMLRIGHNPGQPSGFEGYVSIRNPAWASFYPGERIAVRVTFDNASDSLQWVGQVVPMSDGSQALNFDQINTKVVGLVAAASSMTITYNGKVVLSVRLDDSTAGAQKLVECEVAYNSHPAPADPFRSTTSSPATDPFKKL
jgi:hypothetical protein